LKGEVLNSSEVIERFLVLMRSHINLLSTFTNQL
jgi:hypothetical protein